LWWGILRERNYLEDPGVNEKIILRWILRKWNVGACTELMCLRLEARGGYW
jgi:hypothetical protein